MAESLDPEEAEEEGTETDIAFRRRIRREQREIISETHSKFSS